MKKDECIVAVKIIDRKNRDCILAVKVTAEEKKKIVDFAAERCVNVSALVRKLLFKELDSNKEAK